MRIGKLLKAPGRWLLATREGPLRFRGIDVVLWWVLISLVGISFIGDHPLVALTIAITGGAMIGVLSVMGADAL